MDLNKVFDNLFAEGVFALIGVFILFGMVLVINRFFQEKVLQRISSVFNKISNKFSNKRHHIITEETREVISSVNSDLSELRAEMYADRAFIYHFHNGTHFTSKYPSWKLSNTFIKVGKGISNNSRRFQDIQVSLIWDDFVSALWLKREDEMRPGISIVNKNQSCVIKSCTYPRKVLLIKVSELNYSGSSRLELEEMGVYCFLIAPILDSTKENIIGFVGIDYNDKETYNELINDENFSFCKLCKFVLHLTAYFSLNDISETQFVKTSKKYIIT